MTLSRVSSMISKTRRGGVVGGRGGGLDLDFCKALTLGDGHTFQGYQVLSPFIFFFFFFFFPQVGSLTFVKAPACNKRPYSPGD